MTSHPNPAQPQPADRELVETWGVDGVDEVTQEPWVYTGSASREEADEFAERCGGHVVPLIAADRLTDPSLAEALCIRLHSINPEGWSVQDTLAALRAHLEGK